MGESQTQGRNRIQLSVTDIQKGSCYVDFWLQVANDRRMTQMREQLCRAHLHQ